MKIKQQKQIKKFLVEEFGKNKGESLFSEQEKMLDTLLQTRKTSRKIK